MLKPYDYVYYKILRFIELLDDEMPSFIALCFLGVLNAFQLVIAWSIILYFSPEIDDYRTKPIGSIIALTIFGFNYFRFEYQHKYTVIYNHFVEESNTKQLIGTILVCIFIGLTIFVCFKISGPWIVDNF